LMFVHNGTLFMPDQVLSELGQYRNLVLGVNDSEVLFAYFVLNLERSRNVEQAFTGLENGLREIYNKSKYEGKYPYSSLNSIFSDGKSLYAYERYLVTPKTESFCHKTPYFEMYYKTGENEIVVASEKLDSGYWEPIPNGGLLSARMVEGKVAFDIKRIEIT
jgi:predicted glutamine amidotransferase